MRGLSLLIAMVAGATLLRAQNHAPADTGVEHHGSITAGYRFADIRGQEQKYRELFDLRKGFRLFELDLYGRPEDNANRFADRYSLHMSGLGGDPFPGGQLTVQKNRLYDLRLNYRQSYYYWNRNDDAIQPTGLHGLTSSHDWATVRKFGSVYVGLNATPHLRFNFDYHRAARYGSITTTRVLDYFGSPGLWGSFERANPYVVEAPVNEVANRVSGGVSYALASWNLFYNLGYQTYEERAHLQNIQTPQRSVNIDDPATAAELLGQASLRELRQLKAPSSSFSYNGRLGRRLELRGAYIFYRYHGPAFLTAAFNGSARTTTAGTTVAPYAIALNSQVSIREPVNVVQQGVTYRFKDWFSGLLDYRYSRFDVNSTGVFHSVRDGTALSGESEIEWRYGLHTLDLNLELTPARQLILRPGVRLMKRDVTVREDGVADPVRSKQSKFVVPIASVYYAPSGKVSIRGDVMALNNGTPYTRISPRTDVASRVLVLYRPNEKLSAENHADIVTAKVPSTDFRNTLRANATTIRYNANDRLALFGGLSYYSYFATAFVRFIRGVPPLTVTWRDQTINRVWQAGIEAKPAHNLGIRVSGNYDRTTGTGEISDEPPIFGPLTWPMVTGTVFYDIPRAGRLSIDVYRTYYIEEIVTGNNFSANLLSLRWTQDF